MYTGSGSSVLHIAKSITLRAQTPGKAILDGNNERTVIHITRGTVKLQGLVITRGLATNEVLVVWSSELHGGGICISGDGGLTDVSILSCTVADNAASHGGGISIVAAESVLIRDSIIERNMAFAGAGLAIMKAAGLVTVMNSRIRSNVMDSPPWLDSRVASQGNSFTAAHKGDGGGVFVYGDESGQQSTTFEATEIYGNYALRGGGAFLATRSSVVFRRCSIRANDARFVLSIYYPEFQGGGLMMQDGFAHIADTNITGNEAGYGSSGGNGENQGGGIFMEGGDMLLTRTLIKDNTAVRLDFTQASGAAALGANGANILRVNMGALETLSLQCFENDPAQPRPLLLGSPQKSEALMHASVSNRPSPPPRFVSPQYSEALTHAGVLLS